MSARSPYLDDVSAILNSPKSPVCKEVKSRLDRLADGLLRAHGYNVFGQPRHRTTSAKAMSQKTAALLDVMLQLRRAGYSLTAIARRTGLHRNTVSVHFAQMENGIAPREIPKTRRLEIGRNAVRARWAQAQKESAA